VAHGVQDRVKLLGESTGVAGGPQPLADILTLWPASALAGLERGSIIVNGC
jgi:hypothetical protein